MNINWLPTSRTHRITQADPPTDQKWTQDGKKIKIITAAKWHLDIKKRAQIRPSGEGKGTGWFSHVYTCFSGLHPQQFWREQQVCVQNLPALPAPGGRSGGQGHSSSSKETGWVSEWRMPQKINSKICPHNWLTPKLYMLEAASN